MWVNCVAGTQYCVTAILDTMQYVSCPVSTVALGCVAGPPVMLVAGGDKGKRYGMTNSRIILSQPLGGLAGTSIEVKIQAIELNRNAKAQAAFIAKFSGQDVALWQVQIDHPAQRAITFQMRFPGLSKRC